MKRCKKKQISTKKRLEILEEIVLSMRSEVISMHSLLDPRLFHDFHRDMILVSNSTNRMVNCLEGVEVALAKLIPKETIQFLPQFRDKRELDVSIL